MMLRLVFLLLVLLSPWTSAWADQAKPLDPEATAAQHFALAVQAFHAGQWGVARTEFTASYDLTKKPDLLRNLSLTAEQQATVPNASRVEARAALADAISYEHQLISAKPAERAECEARIRDLQKKLTALEDVGRPNPEGQRPRSRAGLVAGALGLSLGGGMLIAAVGTGASALALKSDLEGRPITQAELDEGLARGGTLKSATIALAVVGGTVAIGSITLLALSRRRSP